LPRKTRKQLVTKYENIERAELERALKDLRRALRRAWREHQAAERERMTHPDSAPGSDPDD